MQKTILFFLHFAGGNVASYNFLKSHFPQFECISLELPGRGNRVNEPLVHNIQSASLDLYRQVLEYLNPHTPFRIYGHSMGALLALRLAHMLESTDYSPVNIIVTGHLGPVTTNPKSYKLDKKNFEFKLRELGGTPEGIFINEELFSFFEPIIRADLEVAENYNFDDFKPITVPIYLGIGKDEIKQNYKWFKNWEQFTTSELTYDVYNGGHFFIYKEFKLLAQNILNFIQLYEDYPKVE